MSLTTVSAGLACGALLTAVGLALWDVFRQMPGLSLAVRAVRWLAGALMLIGALFAWQEDYSLSTLASRLILMATLAAPPPIRRRQRSRWGSVMSIPPALLLAGAGLFWISRSISSEAGGFSVALAEPAVVICGGLGARALGQALSEMATAKAQVEGATLSALDGPALSIIEGPSAATYVLLTLIVGGTALVNLWQRGLVWGGTTSESRLAGTWLAWSAARLGPRQPHRLRATLIALAALLLMLTALS